MGAPDRMRTAGFHTRASEEGWSRYVCATRHLCHRARDVSTPSFGKRTVKRRTFLTHVPLIGAPLVGAAVVSYPGAAVSAAEQSLTPVESPVGAKLPGAPHRHADVTGYGAKGDGTTDDWAAIQRAVEGARHVYFPAGNYLIRRSINLGAGSSLVGDGAATLTMDGTSSIFKAAGTIGPRVPLGRGARRGDKSFMLAAGGAPDFLKSGGFFLQSDDPPLGMPSHFSGELGVVAGIDGNEVHAGSSILSDYRIEARAAAAAVLFLPGIVIRGLRLRNRCYADKLRRPTSPLIYFEFVTGFRIFDNDLGENNSAGVSAFNCLNGLISGNSVSDLADGGEGLLGYGVQVGFSSQNIAVASNTFTRCRHGVTTGTGTRASQTPGYGVSRGIAIIGNAVAHCSHAGLDTHEDSDGVTISGNTVTSCSPVGIQIRSCRSVVNGNVITSCAGKAIRVARTSEETLVTGNVIRGVRQLTGDGDGVVVDGLSVTVSTNAITDCDRHGISVQSNAVRDVIISGNSCKNCGLAAAGDGINIDRNGTLPGLLIAGNLCSDDQSGPTQRHNLAIESGTTLSRDSSLVANNMLLRARADVFANRGAGSPRLEGNVGLPVLR